MKTDLVMKLVDVSWANMLDCWKCVHVRTFTQPMFLNYCCSFFSLSVKNTAQNQLKKVQNKTDVNLFYKLVCKNSSII